MTPGKFFDNPAFLSYVWLLRQLHGLIRAGHDETPEGEALRQALSRHDTPGYHPSGCIG